MEHRKNISHSLQDLFSFSEMLNQFRLIERMIFVNGEERRENNVEHTYQLAMLAWYIIDTKKLSLDKNLVLRYALVHDLVEVYAGDTYIYSKDKEHLESKEEREREAVVKLKKTFPEFSEMHTSIEKYEKREDKESRFVYALDKVQPIINIYLDEGRTWKHFGVVLSVIQNKKGPQIKISPEADVYFTELMDLCKENEETIFSR